MRDSLNPWLTRDNIYHHARRMQDFLNQGPVDITQTYQPALKGRELLNIVIKNEDATLSIVVNIGEATFRFPAHYQAGKIPVIAPSLDLVRIHYDAARLSISVFRPRGSNTVPWPTQGLLDRLYYRVRGIMPPDVKTFTSAAG